MFLGGCERWMLQFWMFWKWDVMILDALILIQFWMLRFWMLRFWMLRKLDATLLDASVLTRSNRKRSPYSKHIRDVEHVLWAILHVDYDGDRLLAIRAHLGESRSRSGQILKSSISENKDMVPMQNVPRNQMVPFFFCTLARPPKIAFDCMTLLVGVTL